MPRLSRRPSHWGYCRRDRQQQSRAVGYGAAYQPSRLLKLVDLDVQEQFMDAVFLAPIFRVLELFEGFRGHKATRAQEAPEYSQCPAAFSAPRSSQQCLVVVARLRLAIGTRRRVVPLPLADALELLELRLLVL